MLSKDPTLSFQKKQNFQKVEEIINLFLSQVLVLTSIHLFYIDFIEETYLIS
jgi:hypothetical protein